MQNSVDSLEEGEIADDLDYTPLERPENYSASVPSKFPVPVIQDSDSEDDPLSVSETDSDSDSKCYEKKRPKLKLKPKPLRRHAPKQKKYDIWSTRVQEDVLAETLNSCDVTFKDRSRDVESYDYTLGPKYLDSKRTNNKRSRVDRDNKQLKQVRRFFKEDKDNAKSNPRNLLDLVVTLENAPEDIGKDLANKLCEEKEDLLVKIVEIAGKQKVFDIFRETKRIEAEGGMMIMNGSRRRTPGGVFLFLLRHDSDLTEDQQRSIFDEDRQRYKEVMKAKQKLKNKKLKQKIAAEKANKNLPELLTKAELCVQKLATENDRSRRESDHADVINPPPTPETDCHENSGDGMESINPNFVNKSDSLDSDSRKIECYDVDFLDLGCESNMDLF